MGPVVVVGHSAGAAAGSWMAPLLINGGVDLRGLVFVDGNDSPNHLIEKAWPEIRGRGIRAVMTPPSPCNRQGRLTDFLRERGCTDIVVIPGAGHGDLEMSGAAVYRRLCGDVSSGITWRAVQQATLDAINALYEGGAEIVA